MAAAPASDTVCITPRRSLLKSIKKLFWSSAPPGTAPAIPEKLMTSLSITPQSPIASATPQKRSAAVERARRRLLKEQESPPSKDSNASDADSSEQEVLFSPATWRHDDEEENSRHRQASAHEEEPEDSGHAIDLGDEEFCPYRFIKRLPSVEAIAMSRPVSLPDKVPGFEDRMTLVLDLDETLVHCSIEPLPNSEMTFPVLHCGHEYQVHVRRRPFFKEFCEKVSQWFEIIVFTASQRVYADRLLDILDPKGVYFQHRLFRDHCHLHEGNYLKDLRVLNRDLRRVAIIDNSVQAFGLHLDNGIPVESWFSEDSDMELIRLLPFLEGLKDAADVRPHIRRRFRLHEVISSLA
ncbi:FCP1 homology domain-containing protein [Plasmodiophora brassicae]|uniref:FCP1 homology domain-containing protein n=1 Tax=Plasmodiophora brassicae TaxID=37360 RepID=A0A0G4J6Y6_PLABS|nr:hypothetical protein PBRA_003042 [Plasmodiophora brassicae]SPQ95518.1 unnamed protein product [Plasmodiophora brassicae]